MIKVYFAIFLSLLVHCSIAQQWNQYNNTNSPITDASKITSVAVGNDVWIAAGDIVYRKKSDGTWVQYPVASTNGLVFASVISAGSDGTVWVGANDQSGLLSRFDGSAWLSLQIPQSVVNPDPFLQYIEFGDIEITDNYVWVGTNQGAFQFDKQNWIKLNYQNKLTQPTSLSWDSVTHELWISNNCAPYGNVFKYVPATNSWTEYVIGNSKCAHAIQAINGTAMIGSCNYSSVLSIKNGVIQPSVVTDCIGIGAVAIDPVNTNQAWFGTDGFSTTIPSGLILFNGNSVTKTFNNLNSGMKGNYVRALTAQKKGNITILWLSTRLYNPDFSSTSFLETYTYGSSDPLAQVITFSALPSKYISDAPFPLTAIASSGLPVTYKSSAPQVATVSGNQVTIIGPGSTDITASQAGNDNYLAAKDVVQTLLVTPCPLLDKPVITVNLSNPSSPVLTSSSTTGNQWFFNTNAIAGATQSSYTVTQVGTYTVQVIQGSCSSPVSDAKIITITGLEKEIISNLYPNPAGNEIKFTAAGKGAVSIQIIDFLGRQVKQLSYQHDGEIKIEIADLTPGSYILKASQEGYLQNIHFIKK